MVYRFRLMSLAEMPKPDPALRWQPAEPSLEDVFILNMRAAEHLA